jgi:tetratricopeptide (TPR) repeat protein
MKQPISVMCAGLILSAMALGQTQPATGTQQQPQQTAPQQTAPTPTTPPQAPQQQAPPPPATGQAPAKKTVPQAKTQEEYAAYNTVAAQADVAAAEIAANDFAQKFPQSELTSLLYGQLMQKYYSQNKPDKTIEMGRKTLKLDPSNPLAAAMVATALAESTRETDLDRDEKYVEALRDAEMAVKGIDSLVFPPTLTPQQIADTKNDILALAHSSMGYIEMARKNYGISEQHLKNALAISTAEPDPINYLRLSVVQDNQKKYPEALVSANKAVELAQAQNNAPVLALAKNEKDRLTKLSAGSPKPAAPATQITPPKN